MTEKRLEREPKVSQTLSTSSQLGMNIHISTERGEKIQISSTRGVKMHISERRLGRACSTSELPTERTSIPSVCEPTLSSGCSRTPGGGEGCDSGMVSWLG